MQTGSGGGSRLMGRGMDLERFLEPDSGRVLGVLETDDHELSSLRYGLPESGYLVREVRARRMSTVSGVFDEFAAAFQFPYYFGENKDAFDECLRDLDEFVGAATGFVVVVRDATRLLSLEPNQWPWFADAMNSAARAWAGKGTPVAFRVVLQGVPAQARQSSNGEDLPTLQLGE